MARTKNKVIDWTPHRMRKSADEKMRKGDESEAMLLDHTLQLYEDGMIEIEWIDGEPMFSLTPEARVLMDVLDRGEEEKP